MAKQILVVDDDPDLVEMLRIAFDQAGYLTRTAASGREALRKAEASVPDVILLDVMLPELNGFTVCEHLRGQRATALVPIVLMTALPGEFPRLVSSEVGATLFLNKPFDVARLVAQVGDLLAAPLLPAPALRTSAASRPDPGLPGA